MLAPQITTLKSAIEIAGTETFTDQTLATIEALGFDIKVIR